MQGTALKSDNLTESVTEATGRGGIGAPNGSLATRFGSAAAPVSPSAATPGAARGTHPGVGSAGRGLGDASPATAPGQAVAVETPAEAATTGAAGRSRRARTCAHDSFLLRLEGDASGVVLGSQTAALAVEVRG